MPSQSFTALRAIVSKTGCKSVGELEITRRISLVAACCSSASERCSRASASWVRASASSRVRASSFFSNSARGSSARPMCALAFVPVERSLRPRVGLFAPLRDKVTSSAQSLGLLILTHDELASSLDHLVGAEQERLRDFEVEGLGGRKIDDEIKLS